MTNTEWNLNDIYATEEELQKDWDFVETGIEKLKHFEGKLNTEKAILEYLMFTDEIEKRLDKIHLMRYLKKDEDILDEKSNKQFNEVKALSQRYSKAQTFFKEELLKNPQDFLDNMIINEPGLKIYERLLKKIVRQKSHILSKEEEDILKALTRTFRSFSSIYDTLTDGDLEFDDVYDSKGIKHEATQTELLNYMQGPDRVLRKSAFESLYAKYKRYAHTISGIYLAKVLNNTNVSKIYRYPSFFEEAMENSDSSVEVYNSLIKAVNDNLEINHRYYKLKKKLLGLEEMYQYDKLAPIVQETSQTKYSYEEAKEIVLEALKPLGKGYIADLKRGFESNWTHVYPKENKTRGAYQYSMYGTHPYVLLNFSGTLDDVSAVAHEFGHAMHSYYSNQTQPYATVYYSIMVAEVVSTTNEILLSENLIKGEKDLIKKINYLQLNIENFNATVIRQVMFAEFEKWVYEETRNGKELTCEELCKFYAALVRKYFGEAIKETDGIQYEWARIPHFYRPFYVYKYATGMSSAICIAENLSKKGEEYAEKYIEMLKMGGSINPLDQLRSVGVDLETGEPIQKAFKYYESKINELEQLMQQLNK